MPMTEKGMVVCNAIIESNQDGAIEAFKIPTIKPDTFAFDGQRYTCNGLGLINAFMDQIDADRVEIQFDKKTDRPIKALRHRRPKKKGNQTVRVFEIDDGAIYFVGATNIREAVRVYWKAVDDMGGDEEPHLEAHEITEKRARHILINLDGRGEKETAWAIAQREGVGVLGCSEWP